jgi:hypothetical protein
MEPLAVFHQKISFDHAQVAERRMAAELDWLNGLSRIERNLWIVISHDEDERRAYIEQGILATGSSDRPQGIRKAR